VPSDIRDLQDDPDGYAAELRRRWGGLLSYRYIGRRYAQMDVGPVDNTVTLRHDMRDSVGGILLSVLGIASPEGGAMTDLEDVPNPVIHSCQVLDPGRDVRRIEVIAELLHRGRQLGYSRSRIVDADDPARVLALTEGQGISLGKPPDGLVRMDTEPLTVTDSPDLPPLWQVFGAQRRDVGEWGLPELSEDVSSPDGALHIGPQFVVLEAAARDVADSMAAGGLQSSSSHVMFLARGKVGPFRTVTRGERGRSGALAVRVELRDEGAEGRRVTASTYVFREIPEGER
jgi:acyl-coenzyme A thioesterase PaaI-like protein